MIRKNTATLLKLAATAIENAKVPTKAQAATKLNEYRIRAAALMMPKDMAFIITYKNNI
jgi:hypothetical protein